jgi:hypothetical protein
MSTNKYVVYNPTGQGTGASFEEIGLLSDADELLTHGLKQAFNNGLEEAVKVVAGFRPNFPGTSIEELIEAIRSRKRE